MSNPHISLCQKDELVCLQIEHPRASALIALQGAQLLEYTPANGKPVLWLSELAEFKKGHSVRGGIPLCWPWFGDARRNPETVQQHLPVGDLPAHGWVRSQPWLVDQAESDDAGVSLRLSYPDREWPQPFPQGVSVSVQMHIGRELEVQLLTRNDSATTVALSQALHTYFAVSDVANTEIHQLEDVTFLDTLDDWREKSEAAPLGILEETDRIYMQPPELIRIDDSGWGRQILIRSRHSASAVVWNPWIEKSKRLSQFAEDAYRRMLCIETANAASDVITLAPGEQASLGVTLSSQ